MGLDMYLNAKRYFFRSEDETLSKQIGELVGVSEQRVSEVVVEAAYWRKANHIHKWFVDNVQDGEDNCEEHTVSREQLAELRQRCNSVLNAPNKAPELLPAQEGFFFGGTEYDEWYFDGTRNTIKMIDEALKLPSGWWFTYRSSW